MLLNIWTNVNQLLTVRETKFCDVHNIITITNTSQSPHFSGSFFLTDNLNLFMKINHHKPVYLSNCELVPINVGVLQYLNSTFYLLEQNDSQEVIINLPRYFYVTITNICMLFVYNWWITKIHVFILVLFWNRKFHTCTCICQ